jgi:myo-inositol-1(or 4)-monophosphatase
MIGAELAARVDFARRLAREAGALANRYFLREIAFEAQTKGPQDWVSAADLAVEDLIRRRLAEAFPGDTVYGD